MEKMRADIIAMVSRIRDAKMLELLHRLITRMIGKQ